MQKTIFVIDLGSEYTQLIARQVRKLNVYCEIHPYHNIPDDLSDVKGVILSGSTFNIHDRNAPRIVLSRLDERIPLLGIGYGAQLLVQEYGGQVEVSSRPEYLQTSLSCIETNEPLFRDVEQQSQVLTSPTGTLTQLPKQFIVIARTADAEIAAFKATNRPLYGLQFHPEAHETTQGQKLFFNFIVSICGCKQDWTPDTFVQNTVDSLKKKLGGDKVVLGLSGGVDSSVAGVLLHKAIGSQLYCIFVDNGLLRKNEFEQVLNSYQDLGLNVKGIRAGDRFLGALKGISDPEEKRKTIGRVFIEVFDREAHKISNVKWLAQGTIYPDVIESISVKGSSVSVKSHHNVGGLPDFMKLKVVEPLNTLFKDEVRRVGVALGMSPDLLQRHPFPGPGLGIRILGEVTAEKVRILQEVDHVFISALRENGLYNKVWQALAVLLPVHSVGVFNSERTYGSVVALRAVQSVDGMTAVWANLPYDFLAKVSEDIIKKVNGVNRVTYDISSKPPATIEWE